MTKIRIKLSHVLLVAFRIACVAVWVLVLQNMPQARVEVRKIRVEVFSRLTRGDDTSVGFAQQ